MDYYVYLYRKPDNTPFYVGKGKDDRAYAHLLEAKKENTLDNNKHKINTIKKILNTGKEPIIQIVDYGLSEETAFELECFLISEIGRADLGIGPLTNMTDGGEGLSGLVRDLSGENNPNYGKRGKDSIWWNRKHSDETKQKMSKWQKGVPKSEEAKANMRKPKSEQGRANIAEARIKLRESGYKPSEESNQKRSQTLKGRPSPMKGKTRSEESRTKQSQSTKGKPKSKIQCPHCNREIAHNVYYRWHGDNCKERNNMFSQNSAQISDSKLWVDDCFSTYLYTGTGPGSTQTITNGIDLAGKGGMVWSKNRSTTGSHELTDTVSGAQRYLQANSTNAQAGVSTVSSVQSFLSNGYTLPAGDSWINYSPHNYVSWTFRRAPKFFDVVTYTGDGSTSHRTISHSLGCDPGMVVIKRMDGLGDWSTMVRRGENAYACGLFLNTTGAQQSNTMGINANDLAQNINVLNVVSNAYSAASAASMVNVNGATYVAYLFAHDPSADGIIQCGSFNISWDSSGNITPANVLLGWEPQLLLCKRTDDSGDWYIFDSSRGFTISNGVVSQPTLNPNSSSSEYPSSSLKVQPTTNGFLANGHNPSTSPGTYSFTYLAIRRPNKPPTSGTQVFRPISATAGGLAQTGNRVPRADLIINKLRGSTGLSSFVDRLRGLIPTSDTQSVPVLRAESTAAEVSGTSNGFLLPTNYGNSVQAPAGEAVVSYFLARAPGVFDVVCYTGNGVNGRLLNHNLNSAPELILIKARNFDSPWYVYSKSIPINRILQLNSPYGQNAWGVADFYWGGASHTSSVFQIGSDSYLNANSGTFVAYLFATLPGISKVGSYTGNGSSQTINCGFTTGARFFLVKATSTTGNWWVFDSARGIVSSFDPSLALNSTNAEVTSADAVDPDPTGIIVNQEATCSINATGVNYVFLAIA